MLRRTNFIGFCGHVVRRVSFYSHGTWINLDNASESEGTQPPIINISLQDLTNSERFQGCKRRLSISPYSFNPEIMPKTRNISRSQWSAAHLAIASNSSTVRKRRNNNTVQEDEKENMGRSTIQTRTHRRGSILGGANPTAVVPGSATMAAKKGKGKASQKKEKKLPLQDITSQFLPAPESANRGAGLIADELGREPRGSTATALPPPLVVESPQRPVNASPLPPSSPPSELPSPIQLNHPVFDKWLEGMEMTQPVHDPLQFGDHTKDALHDHDIPSHTSSDPFGFTAVERKLRVEREIAAAMPHEENEEDYYEDLNDIPVADTSSPRPFGLIRSRSSLERNEFETEKHNEQADEEPPTAFSHSHLVTPPTPHKDKAKHPRPSHGGRAIFSPCSSSIESSPSPTKTSASKRPRHVQTDHDPLEEFNEEFEKSCGPSAIVDKLPPSKRRCQTRILSDRDEGHQEEVAARNLRPRRQKPEVTVQADDKTGESQKRKKPSSSVKDSKLTKKPASKLNSSKKVVNDDGDDDEVSGVLFEIMTAN